MKDCCHHLKLFNGVLALLALLLAGCGWARIVESPMDQDTMEALVDSENPLARHMAWRENLLAATAPELDALRGRTFYTCCNLTFDASGRTSDANYSYPNVRDNLLPFGSRVKVTGLLATDRITIQPEGGERLYSIRLSYGTDQINPEEYFRNILREQDPKESLQGVDLTITQSVIDGKIIVGMTKEQVLMARGYPPFHSTSGIESDSWRFYRSGKKGQVVLFSDGKVRFVQEWPDAAPFSQTSKAVASNGEKSIEDRLRELLSLHEKGLISTNEMQARRVEILREL